tara:strand:- start:427 stop:1806 length:1380 start_codon:yes stop_codon:yes gene_type:complete
MYRATKVLAPFISLMIFFGGVIPVDAFAITAEDRLIDVERQLQAIADEIRQYEGERTELEQQILQNDQALKEVNTELVIVKGKLSEAEKALELALQGYDASLDELTKVQTVIVDEQSKLGKIQTEISKVTVELVDTQVSLEIANSDLDEQAVNLYMNGVMSPATALFVDLDDLTGFIAALGYSSVIVDSANKIVDQLNALEDLAETQTEYLMKREEARQTTIDTLREEEERKVNLSIAAAEYADEVEESKQRVEEEKIQVEAKKAKLTLERQRSKTLLYRANKELEKLDKEHADLETLEDAIQADILRLSTLGGVAPDQLLWPVDGGYISSGYKWRRLGGTTSFHGAIDIAVARGTPIKAAAGGVVILARYYGLAGKTVFIDHGGGMTTLYFHMDRIDVTKGDTVVIGDQIGTVGTTGRSTGSHLHFETRLANPYSVSCNYRYLDPTSRGRVNPLCFLP